MLALERSPAAAPADGDLLIATDDSSHPASYLLSVVPHPAQVRCASYAHAVRAASEWTARQPVTIWFTGNGRTFGIVTAAMAEAAPDQQTRARHAK